MKATFKTFISGKGDCIFFIVQDGEKKISTMIDCGRYTLDIKQYVEETLEKHIDILVVTHIDCDHIDGLAEMLGQTPDLRIDRILYNCNQLWNSQPNGQATDSIKNDILAIGKVLHPRHIMDSRKINASKAITLAELLINNELWNKAWKKDEYVTIDTDPIVLNEGDERFGSFTVLSPSKECIDRLNNKYRVEYSRLRKQILEDGGYIKGQETLFELVERVAAMKRENYKLAEPEKLSASNPFDENNLKLAKDFIPLGVTDENEASIALLWKYDNKRVLFMGDAEPDNVANQLNILFKDDMVNFEVIKVSHHGSKHSTSHVLLSKVDSEHYFFTGGNLRDKPSLEAIIKIVDRKNEVKRMLHFNNIGNIIYKNISSERGSAFQKHYGFIISESDEYQFEY